MCISNKLKTFLYAFLGSIDQLAVEVQKELQVSAQLDNSILSGYGEVFVGTLQRLIVKLCVCVFCCKLIYTIIIVIDGNITLELFLNWIQLCVPQKLEFVETMYTVKCVKIFM